MTFARILSVLSFLLLLAGCSTGIKFKVETEGKGFSKPCKDCVLFVSELNPSVLSRQFFGPAELTHDGAIVRDRFILALERSGAFKAVHGSDDVDYDLILTGDLRCSGREDIVATLCNIPFCLVHMLLPVIPSFHVEAEAVCAFTLKDTNGKVVRLVRVTGDEDWFVTAGAHHRLRPVGVQWRANLTAATTMTHALETLLAEAGRSSP
ncbi:MAG: hypothetical protein ACYS8W_07875 [Planctomycetota bacterium]|jgi:hypothetical protein